MDGVSPGVAEIARRYITQVALSLRPSTVAHIEHDLREFGTWLAAHHPEVASCADLARAHIEQFKTWLASRRGLRSGMPLGRPCIKSRLHCFFDRITKWGYPSPPQRPLLFAHHRPLAAWRIAIALHWLGAEAGIGRVTTLATQAINRGMSLDAIAALLGHKTLGMT